ncbi:1-aminocyclopropane-1-carboxylate deaminase/D-cysteine desulfhydrase [Jiulongibacter sp. NS-SX5]|uniref:1-aminocyclopropane-1-carboxylate deaminase/D-cysteine desulfhydrase n=1 Tax=Jiulongibacter sp. NS-SX5 TaxID=3463854 RepID=UPI004058DF88
MKLNHEVDLPTPLVKLTAPIFDRKGIEVWVKEDYKTDKAISGNKYRKLKYNLLKARTKNQETILTFGGAYSNHIYATAAAGKRYGFKTIGIIRGDELNELSSPTLQYAHEQGMKFFFVSREKYRSKEECLKIVDEPYYLIPEGGTNKEALQGVSEMVSEITDQFSPSHILCAAGTGGTAAGIRSNSTFNGELVVIPVLKNGGFIQDEMMKLMGQPPVNTTILTNYHFGGYGKWNYQLSNFIEIFESNYDIPLDPVYTGKLFNAAIDLTEKNYFLPGSKVVIYHSGGLQGKPVSL